MSGRSDKSRKLWSVRERALRRLRKRSGGEPRGGTDANLQPIGNYERVVGAQLDLRHREMYRSIEDRMSHIATLDLLEYRSMYQEERRELRRHRMKLVRCTLEEIQAFRWLIASTHPLPGGQLDPGLAIRRGWLVVRTEASPTGITGEAGLDAVAQSFLDGRDEEPAVFVFAIERAVLVALMEAGSILCKEPDPAPEREPPPEKTRVVRQPTTKDLEREARWRSAGKPMGKSAKAWVAAGRPETWVWSDAATNTPEKGEADSSKSVDISEQFTE